MTVAELIDALKSQPPDKAVCFDDAWHGMRHIETVETDDEALILHGFEGEAECDTSN